MSFDYAGRAQSRLIAQYRNDAKMRTLLAGLANLVNTEFENAADIRRLLYSIDDMSGVQLDLIGRVLVRPRPAVLNVSVPFFGYEGTPGAVGYNVAPYFDYSQGGDIYIALPDGAYRKLLKATAVRNNTDCSIDSIILAAQVITGDEYVTLINHQNMTFELLFSEEPDAHSTIVINNFNVIPEPAGVRFDGWSIAGQNWVEYDSLFTDWEDDAAPNGYSDWIPESDLQTENFTQERTYNQNQIRMEQKREIDTVTGAIGNVGAPIEHSQTVTGSESRPVTGSATAWSDTDRADYTDWLPEPGQQETSYTQSRTYTQNQERTWTYQTGSTVLGTRLETQSLTGQSESRTVDVDSTEWANVGGHYSCGDWAPDPVLIDHGESFTQERTCKQDQTRDWVHTVGSTEVYVRSENRVIDEQETQTAIGTGQNWVERQNLGNRVRDLAYGNGVFVAATFNSISESNIWTSTNGETWTLRKTGDGVSMLTYGGGQFVAGMYGSYTVWTSPDGETWTQQQDIGDGDTVSPGVAAISSIAFGGGVFVASTANGNIWTSPDGANWTKQQSLGVTLRYLTYGNGLFVGMRQNHPWTSPDGVNWTQQEALGLIRSLGDGGGLFVAGSLSNGRLFTSPDGENWTEQQDVSGGSPSTPVFSLFYGDGLLGVAVGVGAWQ